MTSFLSAVHPCSRLVILFFEPNNGAIIFQQRRYYFSKLMDQVSGENMFLLFRA